MGSVQGLMSSYCLRAILLFIFNRFHESIHTVRSLSPFASSFSHLILVCNPSCVLCCLRYELYAAAGRSVLHTELSGGFQMGGTCSVALRTCQAANATQD